MGWLDWMRTILMLALDLGLGASCFVSFGRTKFDPLETPDDSVPIPIPPDDRPTTETLAARGVVPYGLSRIRPYQRGKIPVVLIHGLGASPGSWARLVETLEKDAVIRRRYQFWTFGYATGEPVLFSASLLRQALLNARGLLDPDHTDVAFDRMVLIGHSMGGLLGKLVARDSGTQLWASISPGARQPVDRSAGGL